MVAFQQHWNPRLEKTYNFKRKWSPVVLDVNDPHSKLILSIKTERVGLELSIEIFVGQICFKPYSASTIEAKDNNQLEAEFNIQYTINGEVSKAGRYGQSDSVNDVINS